MQRKLVPAREATAFRWISLGMDCRQQLAADWTHRLERIPQNEHRPAVPKASQLPLIRSESRWQMRGAIAERPAPCYYELPMSLATSHTLSWRYERDNHLRP